MSYTIYLDLYLQYKIFFFFLVKSYKTEMLKAMRRDGM